MKKLIYLLLLIPLSLNATNYYVATTGNNSNPGTLAQPFATMQKGVDVAVPGDTIFIRGGVYYHTTSIQIDSLDGHGRSGTRANPIVYINYPGESPIFDYSTVVPSYGGFTNTFYNIGISISQAQYIRIIGITVRNVWQGEFDGMHYVSCQGITSTSSANMYYKDVKVHNIAGRAFWHSSGAWNSWDGDGAFFDSDTTRWINCDAWDLCDTTNYFITAPDTTWRPGNSADGWKCHSYQGTYYYWEGCRAWNYTDDAFDPSGEGYRVFNNCWAMSTKKYYSVCHIAVGSPLNPAGYDMEGNGFKATAMGAAYYFPELLSDTIITKYTNCLAMYCGAVGFYNNIVLNGTTYVDNNGRLVNNTSYRNGQSYFETVPNKPRGVTYKNNIAYSPGTTYEAGIYSPSIYRESHNTWDATNESSGWPGWTYSDTVTVTYADFEGLTGTETTDSLYLVSLFTAARQSDGSLPATKPLTLVYTSDLVNAGTNVGLAFSGAAPDIGYVEYQESGTDILAVTFLGVTAESSVVNSTNHTVAVVVPFGTSLTLTPIITHNGASISPASGVSQDFSSPVSYTVTAVDDTSQAWTVSVSVGAAPTVEGGFMRIGNKYAKIGTKFAK